MPQELLGRAIAHYQVTGELGQGGMGEVYRARDSKLGREVAIKVLPAAFTEDRERLARFEREAQILAQLQHPNIASIYGLEEANGLRALVMELVEGPTLAERLENGPLTQEEALAIALQVARALEEAHDKGIVHRDLKPQNIKASLDGKVKVLDFGLAKAMEPAGSGAGKVSELAKSPTLTLGATQMGMILGTAGYMSPEQAKAMPIDKRSDIWSFGVVLYEMLAGGSLFTGDSVGDTLAAVIRAPIELDKLPPETPAAVRRLLRLCLERNPKNRLHDIADARIAIEEALSGRAEPEPAVPGPAVPARSAARWPYVLALAGLAFGLVALWRPWAGSGRAGGEGAAAAAQPFRLEIAPPADVTALPGLAISPDGTQLVFLARGDDSSVGLWLRRLDSYEARLLPGTDGARYPFWAPDSKRLGFFASGQLKVTDLVGTPRNVATTGPPSDVRGGAWGGDDTLLFAPTFRGPLRRVAARGGEVTVAVEPAASSPLGTYRFPQFLEDGRHFVFYASAASGLEPGEILLGELGSRDVKSLGESHSMAAVAPGNRLLYVRGDQLVTQLLDVGKGELAGDPLPLGVSLAGGIAVSGHRSLSASRTGVLALRQDTRSVTRPVWVDRQGKELAALPVGGKAWWYAPRLSPDGRRVAISRYEVGASNGDVWVFDLERGRGTRLTFEGGEEQLAIWSPDGRQLAYTTAAPGKPYAMFLASPDRPGESRRWFESELYMLPDAFLPDGRSILFEQVEPNIENSLRRAALAGGPEPGNLFAEPGAELAAAVSADGQWIAYSSDATRRLEVYARRLDGSDSAVQVSDQGGGQPLWSADGRELFYISERGLMMAAAVEPGPTLRLGPPRALFDAQVEDVTDRQYDVARDGQRFFVNRRSSVDVKPILVLSGWERGAGAAPR